MGVRRLLAAGIAGEVSARLLRLAVWTALGIAGPAVCVGQQTCGTLSAENVEKLAGFVKKKYHVPFKLTVSQEDISFVEGTCFRRVIFTSAAGEESNFSLLLYLSPDQRFLSKDLVDSTVDPIIADREKDKALLESLRRTKAPALGPRDAPVTITLFSEFECPYCKQQAAILRDEIVPSEQGVRILFRNLPSSFHPWSRAAAEAAGCAALQSDEAFWSLHDFLFQHQSELNLSNLPTMIDSYAASAPAIDRKKLKACIQENGAEGMLASDLTLGRQLQIRATPTVFVNAMRIDGVASAEQLRTLIHQLTNQSSPSQR